MFIVSILVGIASLVCWIMVLIKIFQDKEKNGILHGVIGIICGLWALIWGWMNADRFGIKNLMMLWTGLIIVNIILNVMAAPAM